MTIATRLESERRIPAEEVEEARAESDRTGQAPETARSETEPGEVILTPPPSVPIRKILE